MLEFKSRKLDFKLNDKHHQLRFPTTGELKNFQKKHKVAEEDDKFDLIVEFLGHLGLDKEVTLRMEIEHMNTVLETLAGAKKN